MEYPTRKALLDFLEAFGNGCVDHNRGCGVYFKEKTCDCGLKEIRDAYYLIHLQKLKNHL